MKPNISSILLVITLVFVAENLWGAQFHVKSNADLRDALAIAEQNGESDTILIYEGFYSGKFRYASLGTAQLYLIGGYSDEHDPSQEPSKTVLDGGHKGPVLLILTGGSVVISNLTIQNGNSVVGGGGILLGQLSKSMINAVFLWNNIIQNNNTSQNGGGIRMDLSADDGGSGYMILKENIIRENRADKEGGGAYLTVDNESGNNTPGGIDLIGNEIIGNDSDWSGGGAYIRSTSDTGRAGPVTLSHNIISYNECHTSWNPSDNCNGGGVNVITSSYGGTGTSLPVELGQNDIMNNRATGYGGGVQVRTRSQSGVAGVITLNKNNIVNNDAFGGGGAMVGSSGSMSQAQAGDVSIISNNIKNNYAEYHYGGINAHSLSVPGKAGNVIVVNNMITSNRTDGWYGGLDANSYTKYGSGGMVTLTNNTISANEAGIKAGGVGAMVMPGETLNVYNNIIWGNSAPVGGDIVVACDGYGASQRGFHNNYQDMLGAWSSEGNNINQNPQFVGGGDFHLQAGSVCKDAGTAQAPELPSTDFEGWPRIFGSAPDMGADEVGMVYIDPNIFPTRSSIATPAE